MPGVHTRNDGIMIREGEAWKTGKHVFRGSAARYECLEIGQVIFVNVVTAESVEGNQQDVWSLFIL